MMYTVVYLKLYIETGLLYMYACNDMYMYVYMCVLYHLCGMRYKICV